MSEAKNKIEIRFCLSISMRCFDGLALSEEGNSFAIQIYSEQKKKMKVDRDFWFTREQTRNKTVKSSHLFPFRTDAESHILFFDIEGLIVELHSEEYAAMSPTTLEVKANRFRSFECKHQHTRFFLGTRASHSTARHEPNVRHQQENYR